MDTLPIRIIIILIALESFLIGFQTLLIKHYSSQFSDNKNFEALFLSILSITVSIITALYLNKLRSKGRRVFLVQCTSVLAVCFFLSFVIIKVKITGFFIYRAILSSLQTAGQTGLFASILSIVSIQTGEIGFFFAVQILVIIFFLFFGGMAFSIYIEFNEAGMVKFYFCIIALFVFVSFYIYRKLSERHDNIKMHSMWLWLDILKIKVFNFDFTALSLSLGIAQYMLYKLFESLSDQPIGVATISVILAMFTYPISLYCIYKFMRPVNNRVLIFAGLILQSFGLFTLIVFFSDMGDYYKLIGLLCPSLIQMGLVFVIVASLPNMLKTVASKLPAIEEEAISDKISSTVFIAYNKGSITIFILTFILELLTNIIISTVVSSLFILVFALVYEYNVGGVWDYFTGIPSRGTLEEIELNESQELSISINS